ncbi:MAG: glucose-1-phosphate adenylyltransferase subunit GlgD [Clostridia bacterium]|nr:glucose-1-phosphate adenylyltransferase subunit GlgD [Clostridia bacterium]
MNKNFISGIIFSNMHDNKVPGLTQLRSFGSIPFGGRYRLIDFVLSNMVRAQISRVGIVTKSNFKSLMDHLGSGRDWDLARKGGGIVMLPPFALGNNGQYNNRLEALIDAYDFIAKSPSAYYVLSDCDYLYNVDYIDVVNKHIESGADISCICKEMPLTVDQARECVTFHVEGGRINEVRINTREAGQYLCGLHAYVISRELLMKILDYCRGRGYHGFEEIVLQGGVDRLKLMTYRVAGSVVHIGDLEQYYAANMALLDGSLRHELFDDHPVFTKVHNNMPTKYGLDAVTSDSIIADGCLLEGYCARSIIFRGVVIEKGAKVENCILMQGTRVCSGADISGVITDKNVVISEYTHLVGNALNPLFVGKDKTV